MTRNADIRQYAAAQVSNLLGRLAFEVHRAGRSHDADVVHDLRVSIRRFNQGLRVFRQFFPDRDARKIRRRLRAVMKTAAKVRNLDIAAELCENANLSRTTSLYRALAAPRADAIRELHDLLRRWDARNVSSRWRARLGL